MNTFTKTLIIAVAAAGTVGCAGTKFPSLQPSSPTAERRQFERFYPYPEAEAGPAVQGLPRGFERQRSEAARLQLPVRGGYQYP